MLSCLESLRCVALRAGSLAFYFWFSEAGGIKSVLQKVEDSLLERNWLVVLTELHTGIRLHSCLLGAWHPGRESVA